MSSLDPTALRELQDSIDADEVTMRELLGTFLEQSPRLLAEARGALGSQDARTLHRVVHTIKSSAAMFGAAELARLCKALERDASQGWPPAAPARLRDIEREYDRVSAELEAWKPGSPSR